MRHEWLITTLIVFFATIGAFASDSYLPSLPTIKQVFNNNTSTMQLSVTFFIAATFFSQLIYGPYSDRLGRRKAMLYRLFIASLGSIACSVANSACILILARFIQGFGIGVTSTLFRAILRDTFTGIRMSQVASYAGYHICGHASHGSNYRGVYSYSVWLASQLYFSNTIYNGGLVYRMAVFA